MAWWAIILATVVVPLMALTVDITRAGAVKTWLAAATDSACNAQAQISASNLVTRSLTHTESRNFNVPPPHGARVSIQVSVVRSITAVVGNLSSQPVEVDCRGEATIDPIVPLLGTIRIQAIAQAESRWYGGNTPP
jgi:hypothetical protein